MNKEAEKSSEEPKIERVTANSKEISDPVKVSLLPKASQEDIAMLMSYNEMDHLRMTCRVFKNKVGIKVEGGGNMSLLDIGCRNDNLMNFFRSLGYSWMGIDIKPEHGGNLFKGCMEDLPFPDETVHVTFCCHAFEHSENPLQALREMKRVTRMGGIVFISTPIHCQHQIFECDKTHIFVFTKMQMEKLLCRVGLKPLVVEHWNVEGQDDRFASLITIAKVVD